MDAITGSIITTGTLTVLSAGFMLLAQKYRKEYALISELIPRITKEKETALSLLGKLSDFYRNAQAVSADGVITPEEFERIGREGYALLNSDEVKKLMEGN